MFFEFNTSNIDENLKKKKKRKQNHIKNETP